MTTPPAQQQGDAEPVDASKSRRDWFDAIRAPYHPAVVPEAELEQTEARLVPASSGWFVVNGELGLEAH